MAIRDNDLFLLGIGQRVRQRRLAIGISMQELAERLEMSKTGLWQIENGRSEPRAGTLWRMSIVLKCCIDWLVKGDPEP